MLVQAGGLQLGNSVVTPGVKAEDIDYEAILADDHNHELNAVQDEHVPEPSLDQIKSPQLQSTEFMTSDQQSSVPVTFIQSPQSKLVEPGSTTTPRSALKRGCSNTKVRRKVSFAMAAPPEVFRAEAYSTLCGQHPSRVVAANRGFTPVTERADPYTGKRLAVMQYPRDMIYNKMRMDSLRRDRSEILSSTLQHGAQWEQHAHPEPSLYALLQSDNISQYDRCKLLRKFAHDDLLSLISAVRTPSAHSKYQTRQGAKKAEQLEHATNDSDSARLTPEGASIFRALAARCNYLSQDRPDIAYDSKELCREFSVPTLKPLERQKRVNRYLKGAPRLVYNFAWQPMPEFLDLNVDTDFAGRRVTRRSTSGGVALRGTHCIRHWSSTQRTIALSSGEAELGGLAKGIPQGIGIRSIAADLGIDLRLRLRTDATAAMGMARRLGVGTLRHLDTSLLWVQDHVRSGQVVLKKVAGVENPGDAMTKYLAGPDLRGHLDRMHLSFEEGRPKTAPQLTTAVTKALARDKEVLRAQRRLKWTQQEPRSSRQDP